MNKYFIEQINVSDNEYKVVELNIKNNNVKVGDILFSYESSKSTFDVVSEIDGFLYFNPDVKLNFEYKIGTLIAVTSINKLSQNEIEDIFKSDDISIDTIQKNDQIVITKKAQILIDKYNIDISKLKDVSIITEELVQNLVTKRKFDNDFQDISFYYSNEKMNNFTIKPKKLAIIGAGKAALQLLDAIISSGSHTPVIIYDNNENLTNQTLLNIKIKSTISTDVILSDFQDGIFDEIIISFSGDIMNRERIYQDLKNNKIPLGNVIHKTALISSYTSLGVGNLIFANTRIGPFTHLGDNNVISAYCNIEHHNSIGSHNTFGPTVVFSGSCTVGDQNRFGTGIFIEPNVNIGSKCIIASGLTILNNIPNNKLVRNISKLEYKDINLF
jgi:acetyltransferase-like isoleucine patch superfamily enzyme